MRASAIVEALRINFPEPDIETNYCVGGALCISLGWEIMTFPSTYALVRAAYCQFDALPPAREDTDGYIWYLANHVLEANDKGDFEEAWRSLENLLIEVEEETNAAISDRREGEQQ